MKTRKSRETKAPSDIADVALHSILAINIRSIRKKIGELEVLLEETSPDIICISETWLKRDEETATRILGYNFICSRSRASKKGGGVAILAKSAIAANITALPAIADFSQEGEIECCGALWRRSPTTSLIVIALYRAPQGTSRLFLNKLELVLDFASEHSNTNTQVAIAGDFNINMARDSKHSTLDALIDLMTAFHLAPAINNVQSDTFTRITATSSTTLDNIFTNMKEFHCKSLTLALSDHDGLLLTFQAPSNKNNKKVEKRVSKRLFSASNISYFHQIVSEATWSEMYGATSVDEMFEAFHLEFGQLFRCAFPMRLPPIMPFINKWITPAIRKSSEDLLPQGRT
jgi:exonuclease III